MLPNSSGGNEKILKVRLRWESDKSSSDEVANQTKKHKQGAKEVQDQARQAMSTIDRMNKTAGQLASVGAVMGVTFGASFKVMLNSAAAYSAQVGTAEQTSRRWLGSSKAIEEAQLRIGRVIAKEAVPVMEKVADIMEKAADWAEKNPEAIKAALQITGSLAAIGAVLTAAAGVLKAAATVGGMLGKGGLLAGLAGGAGGGINALGGVGAAAYGPAAAGGLGLAGILGAGAGGIGLGAIIYDFLAKNFGLGGGTRLNQFATVGAYGAGKLFGGEQTGQQWAAAIAQFTGATQKAGQASQQAGREIDFTSQEINAYTGYIRQEQVAQRQHNIQVQRMTRDFQRQQIIDEEDYVKQRSRALRDFARQAAFEEMNYYRQRSIRARDFGIETVRMEEDFAKQQRRAREDHELRLWDVLRSGDALAYMREQRQYEKDRSRAEEDYNIQAKRRSEDFARELADQEREFQIQRKQRLIEFQTQQKDAEEDYQIRRRRAQEQFRIQQADLQKDFDEQKLLRRQALLDQLRDMRGGLEQERILRRQFTTAMLNDLKRAIEAGAKGTNLVQGERAAGGYVGAGLYKMHPNEFVLNASTTKEFERAAGGALTQDKVMAALAGGGKSFQYIDQRVINPGVSAADRELIRLDTIQILQQVVGGSNA